MDAVTTAVAKYIKEKGIAVSAIIKSTGLTPNAIYPSLCDDPKRKLRADEFMKICAFLEVDPRKFTA